MKKILTALLLTAVLLSTGCTKKPVEQAVSSAPPVQKKTTVESFGTLKVREAINITLDIPAAVEKIHVVDGQTITAGQKLITLNLNEYRAKIAAKHKELNVAKLELGKAKDNAFIDENTNDTALKKLNNDLKAAEAFYQTALKEYKNQEALYKQGAISQYELEQFKKTLDTKKKEVDDIAFSIESLKDSRQREASNIDIQSEKAATVNSEISIMNSKLQKPYIIGNDIISSIKNGVVYDIGYTAGDILDPTKKLISIMDLDTLYVEAEVSEEFIKDIKLNAAATIIPTADKSKEYKGKVTFIANKATAKNGETIIPVHIAIENNDGFLKPNFNVDVNIDI